MADPPPAGRSTAVEFSRRTLVASALALIFVLLAGIAAVSLLGDDGSAQRKVDGGDARPSSIPRPGQGTAPERASDRGGSEQLAVLGLMVGGIALIGFMVFRGGRRAREGRRLWLAAAATGHDGAVDGHGHLAPTPDRPAPSPGSGPPPDRVPD